MNKFGKLAFTLLVLGLAGFAILRWNKTGRTGFTPGGPATSGAPVAAAPEGVEFLAPLERPENLPAPLPFVPKDGVLDVELSQYAGYAGLILANGGLAPNPDSWITKTHGVKLRLTLSEEDCWPALNSGRLAASSTTVDVLPLYGKAFNVVVPAQFCFSRGADGIVVRKEIRQINNLRGKVLSSARFNETEFFLRYLAQEAGIPVHAMPSADSPPEADKINLLYCEDAEVAAQAFLSDLKNKGGLLAGCVSWAPFTTETVEAAGGAARLLVDSRNLLIVSDVLVVNKGFAQANPAAVAALTEAIAWGNTQLRADIAPHVPLLAKSLGWTDAETREELAKIHFSNLPESMAFFEGSIDSAGSFESIFQSSLLAYGPGVNPNPVSSSWFLDLKPLQAAAAKPEYAGQTVEIRPIRSSGAASIENDPLLTRDIRFYFQPNSAALEADNPKNAEFFQAIVKMLKVSPGSTIILRGHVDDGRRAEFERDGQETLRKMALRAVELSQNRAKAVKDQLVGGLKIEESRIETVGLGWNEPGDNLTSDLKRRVEVRWYTVE